MSTVKCAIFLWAALSLPGTLHAAAPRIEMEILVEPGMNAASSSQKWVKTLSDLGVSGARFRGKEPQDKVGIEARGSGAAAAIHITAQLDARGVLVTTGGAFALSDSTKFKKW